MDIERYVDLGRLDDSFPLSPGEPFTFSAASQAGITRHGLRTLEDEGLVRRAVSGVYVPAHLTDTVDLRARALKLVVPDDCVVVDRHAGWLLGAQMILAPNEHLALRPLSLFRPSGHGRLRNDLTVSGERDLSAEDVIEVSGLAVTTAIRTAWDLGRVRWPSEAISGVDAMFRLGAFEQDEFMTGIRRFRGTRWITTLRAIAPLADGRSESPGESVLRLRCFECGLTGMVPQVEVTRSNIVIARLDLADEVLRAAVEYDGAEWHTSPEQQEHDRERRDTVREDGWLIEAFTGANVFARHRDIEDKLFAFRRKAEARGVRWTG